ncbi:DUF981 family protein [Actinomadura sp. HBU206391]|uniref:DUF981 family protein n=1 Tax=Actinomadura sp. HBU206391 TaxID=2731692 RepID=UPI0016500765|nr:DUF981 family protein [Actinomadura sp. HBU206391]MBC6463835.1 DUF981 family protein [Actinomadura sp. HBU206391]
MILFNTLMGVCAGLVMLLAADALKRIHTTEGGEGLVGTGVALLVVGAPLTFLSAVMAVTWPLTVNPPINVAFAEPALLLGVLALVGGAVLVKGHVRPDTSFTAPTAWVIGAVGLILLAVSSAIFSYDLVGDAPDQEPITGRFKGWENTTFGLVYLVGAVGCLVVPLYRSSRVWSFHVVRYAWIVTGLFFLVFSVLNYRTHIGMLVNIQRKTDYEW